MKLTILTVGSRGDVEPCLALALGLKQAGHDVTLAAGPDSEPFVAARGVRFAPIGVDVRDFLRSEEGKKYLTRVGIRGFLQPVPPEVWPRQQRLMEDVWKAVQGSDALVYNPRVLGAYDVAEKLHVPAILCDYLPQLTPSGHFPFPLFPDLRLGRIANRLSYAALRLTSLPFLDIRNRWRARALGLPPRRWYASDLVRRGRRLPVLYHFSRHLVPPPADWRGPVDITGFWFLDPDPAWRPSADLQAFLEAGPPPVYVGFGSMVSQDPERVTRTVAAALEQRGQRGILMTGWGGLAPASSSRLLCLEQAPHGWLFPRMAAVVHHGGVGTTAAGLRAGKPTVICPYFHDQPYWGKVVHELGAGPPSIPQRELTAERLAAAIRTAVTDEGMRRRAQELGAKIRAEDGVARAVAAIGRHLSAGL
jgi:sterol 3beta-glucosyltransferase